MEIRIRASGKVVTEGEFRAMHPGTSFPAQLTEALINDFGGDVVFEGPQAQPTRYQVSFRDGVEQVSGKWYTKYSVADMNADAIAAKDAQQAKSVREDRAKRLVECDWTQLDDTPLTNAKKLEWATYRQALRDISTQPEFPWEVQWPKKPI